MPKSAAILFRSAALAGLLALAAGGYALMRRHRQRVTGPLHPA